MLTPVVVLVHGSDRRSAQWTLSLHSEGDAGSVVISAAGAPDLGSEVLGAVRTLEDLRERLRRLASTVPAPPDEMLEHEVPYDPRAELFTLLECAVNEDLGGLIDKLRSAATAASGSPPGHSNP